MQINIQKLYDDANATVTLQVKAAKLEVYERITNLITSGISVGILLLFSLFAFLFLNIGLSLWIGSYFTQPAMGFLLVGVGYIVLLVVYLIFRDRLEKNKIKNTILEKVSKSYNDYEALILEQEELQKQIYITRQRLSESFDQIKAELLPQKHGHTAKNDLSRGMITKTVEFILKHLLFRNSGVFKKSILPFILNFFLTSRLYDESLGHAFEENLKLKIKELLKK